MDINDKASKRACELLRGHFGIHTTILGEPHPNKDAYDDNYVIRNYPDEWAWFMQGYTEAIKEIKDNG